MGIGIVLAAIAVLVVALAAFPWGVLKSTIESRAAKALGRPVTIARLRRVDTLSFHPVIEASGIAVPQAAWAGPGELARIATVRIQFGVWPLMTGRFRPEAIALSGGRFAFARDGNGRRNWDTGPDDMSERADPPAIERLTIADTIVSYADARRDRFARVSVVADERRGLLLRGAGTVRGTPVAIVASGGAVWGAKAAQPWPFRAVIDGPAVGMTIAGRMDRALDVGHFRGSVTARGTDLCMVDALIEAGLPGTQPVRLRADVTRSSPDWEIVRLSGTIGRSDVTGNATIRKRDGRTRIDGAMHARRLDFNDIASDEGLRLAAAKRARTGPRVVPDSAIDLKRMTRTDGRLEISARQLLWPGSSPFRNLTGVVTLERSRLDVKPLVMGLTHGRLEGSVSVDQRRGGPVLGVRLDLREGRLIDFFPGTAIDASLVGRFALTGPGRTIRAAIGRSDGRIALIARDGLVPARTASLLGQDVGRGLVTGKDEQAVLRCMVARLTVTNGIARPDPVVIDTSRAQTRASGTIRLSDERLALTLSGAPKQKSLLRLPGAVPIGGSIKSPQIAVPPAARNVGGVVKMLGRAIAGRQEALAVDADCAGLAARAMR